ncbi:hypothetical protein K438DRAFT_1781115 [Mycena galopus ATCC 62051]|nr:hypothetical protein K438DRAFT_1781115 [Mycena galopus ATCC 62051]
MPSASFPMLERTQALWQRMQTVDTLSLTNRLKRPGIRSADDAHLSCSTVAGILADRNVLTLLGVWRETFGALGEMRVLLTEVLLDPGSAAPVLGAAGGPHTRACWASSQADWCAHVIPHPKIARRVPPSLLSASGRQHVNWITCNVDVVLWEAGAAAGERGGQRGQGAT